MTNLPEKTQNLLDSIKDKSLTTKISDLKTKIANMKKFSKNVLLCDVSGSMNTLVDYNDNLRAIDILNNVLESFQGAQIWEFSNGCNKANGRLTIKDSTNMTNAFNCMKANNFKEIILLTDGQPDDPVSALKAAKNLKINIIYIGPKPTPKFLRDLANSTGGQFENVELIMAGSTKELENKIRGLLT